MRDARVWRALHAWPDGGGGGGGSGGGGGAEALVYSGAHLPCFPFWLLLQPCYFTERDLIFTYFSRAEKLPAHRSGSPQLQASKQKFKTSTFCFPLAARCC